MRKTLLTLATVSMVMGSTAAHAGTNELFGGGIGAALGGLLGSQITRGDARIPATAAGVFFGQMIGSSVGTSMDRTDRMYARGYGGGYGGGYYAQQPAYYQTTRTVYVPNYVAPPEPQPVTYVSQTYGTYCREYTHPVTIGSRLQESYGTACLQPDGSWKVVQ